MSFSFSLESILNLRKQETQDAEMRVEYAKRVLMELKKMIAQERDLYFEDREQLNLVLKKSHMNEVSLYDNSLSLRQKKLLELLENLRSCQSDLALFQQNLVQARRNQKMLENLKDLKEKEFLKQQFYKEQRALDEAGSQKFLRLQMREKSEK